MGIPFSLENVPIVTQDLIRGPGRFKAKVSRNPRTHRQDSSLGGFQCLMSLFPFTHGVGQFGFEKFLLI